MKSTKVTLKNGVGKNDLVSWYVQMLGGETERKEVTIKLLDSLQNSLMVWHIKEAYPVKWTGPQLKTDGNAIAIQTLKLENEGWERDYSVTEPAEPTFEEPEG